MNSCFIELWLNDIDLDEHMTAEVTAEECSQLDLYANKLLEQIFGFASGSLDGYKIRKIAGGGGADFYFRVYATTDRYEDSRPHVITTEVNGVIKRELIPAKH